MTHLAAVRVAMLAGHAAARTESGRAAPCEIILTRTQTVKPRGVLWRTVPVVRYRTVKRTPEGTGRNCNTSTVLYGDRTRTSTRSYSSYVLVLVPPLLALGRFVRAACLGLPLLGSRYCRGRFAGPVVLSYAVAPLQQQQNLMAQRTEQKEKEQQLRRSKIEFRRFDMQWTKTMSLLLSGAVARTTSPTARSRVGSLPRALHSYQLTL